MNGEIRAAIALVLVGGALFIGGLAVGQPLLGLGVVIVVIGMLVGALDLVRRPDAGAPQPPPYYPPSAPPPPPYQASPPPPPPYQPPPGP